MKKTKTKTQSNPKTQNKSIRSRINGKIDSEEHKTRELETPSLTKSPKSNETSITVHKDIMSHEAVRNRLCRVSDSDSLTKQGIEGSLANTPELRNISTLCPIGESQTARHKNCEETAKKDETKQNFTIQMDSKKSLSDMQRELDIVKPAQISFTRLVTQGSFGDTVEKTAARINKLFPEGFTLADLYDFLSQKQTKLKPASLNSTVHAVKCAVKETLGMEYDFNPDVRLAVDRCFKKFLKKIPKSQAVSKAVRYETLLEFVKKASPKTALMARFLYQSCMRVTPMCNVKLSDIESVEGEDACWVRVTQKNGVLTSPKVSSHLIRQIIAECKSKVYLFENRFGRRYERNCVWYLFSTQSRKHVKENINPHRLRHSHATHSPNIRAAIIQGGWQNPNVMLNTYSRAEYKLEELPSLDDTPQIRQNTTQLRSRLSNQTAAQTAQAPVFTLGQANTVEQLLEQKAKAEALLLDINNKLSELSGGNAAPEPEPLFAYAPKPQAQLKTRTEYKTNGCVHEHANGHSSTFSGRLNSKRAVLSDNPAVSRLAHTGCFQKGKYKPLNISNGFGYNREKQEKEAHSHTLSKCKSCGKEAKTYQQGKCRSCLEPSLRAATLLINQFRLSSSSRQKASSNSRLSYCQSCRKLGFIYQQDKCQSCLNKSLRAVTQSVNQNRKKAVCA